MVNVESRHHVDGCRAIITKWIASARGLANSPAHPCGKFAPPNPPGTEIIGRFTPDYKWLKPSGILSPNSGKKKNLPGG